MKTIAVRLAQLGATVLVTWFIVDRIGVTWSDLSDLGERWRNPDLLLLGGASAVLLAGYGFSAALWGRMVRELGGKRIGLVRAGEIYFVSNLGRYVPGKIWQLAGLAYLARRAGISTDTATAAALLVQILSLGGATVIGAWMLVAQPAVTGGWGAVGAAVVVGGAVVLSLPPILERGLGVWARLLGRKSGGEDRASGDPGESGKTGRPDGAAPVHDTAGESIALPRRDATFGLRWLAFFTLNWLVYGAAFGIMARSFGIGASLAVLGSAFAAAYVLGYVMVFAPAGIGVREGFLIAFLQPAVGVPAATAAAVIARFWMTLLELLPGMAFAGRAARRAGSGEGGA